MRRERPPAAPAADLAIAVREVAALIRAGLPPDAAWGRLTGAQGGDPAGHLRRWAAQQAAGRGEAVLGAYLFAHHTGAGVAEVLDRIGDHLEREQQDIDARAGALAGPRASMRLLGALPVLGIVLGYALGLNPVGFLTGSALGWAVTGSAAALTVLGRLWARALMARAVPPGPGAALAVAELVAAGLRAGATVPEALVAAARALPAHAGGVGETGRALRAGSAWAEAWELSVDPASSPSGPMRSRDCPRAGRSRSAGSRGNPQREVAELLRTALEPAWRYGLAPAELVRAHIRRVHQRSCRAVAEGVGRLGVSLMLPVGLCCLPAFMLLALVPVVAQLAQQLW